MSDVIHDRYLVQARRVVDGISHCVARDTVLHRQVSVLHATGELAQRVWQVGETLLRLDHPAIATCHDRGSDVDHGAWVVWSEPSGRQFLSAWQRGTVSGMRLAAQMAGIAEAVAHAHARGVAHGDLSAAAILVDDDDRPFVSGFGTTSASVGPVAQRADLIALGGLLTSALRQAGSGVAAHERRELQAIADAAVAAPNRYAAVVDLLADLRAFTAGRVIRAWRRGPLAGLTRWLRRHRLLAASVAACLLTAVGGTTAVASSRSRAMADLAAAHSGLVAAEAAAQLSRTRAERTVHTVAGLADLTVLSDLLAAAEDLWPGRTVDEVAYRRWLEEAETLGARLPEHRRRLSDVIGTRRIAALPTSDLEDLAWVEELLGELIAALERFADPERGEMSAVRRRLDDAVALAAVQTDSVAAAQLQSQIASDPRFRDSGLLGWQPPFGVVPIGTDPKSGLPEFVHLATGERPVRGRNGELEVKARTGIVLVLLPGDTFHMGAQNDDPGRPNWSTWARSDEQPVHAVTLAPFLMSKYEVTQAQWAMFGGCARPADEQALLPAVGVTWEMAMRVVRRAGLELPSEAQWEYAARGRTSTSWWTGDDLASLQLAANVRDASLSFGGPWRDPWQDLAPIGRLRPNGFGLHDVAGNVSEACRDTYSPYLLPIVSPNGHRLAGRSNYVIFRGGTHLEPVESTRSAHRSAPPRDYGGQYGVRPVLQLR